MATVLKDTYRALDARAAATALDAFEAGEWGRKYARPSSRAGGAPERGGAIHLCRCGAAVENPAHGSSLAARRLSVSPHLGLITR